MSLLDLSSIMMAHENSRGAGGGEQYLEIIESEYLKAFGEPACSRYSLDIVNHILGTIHTH